MRRRLRLIRRLDCGRLAEVEVAAAPPRLDRWWEEPPAPTDDPAAVEDLPPDLPPPAASPWPCLACADERGVGGSAYFWQDVAGRVHCIECVPIPSRAMSNGLGWQVLWDAAEGRAVWAPWTPAYWDPFAHLAADGECEYEIPLRRSTPKPITRRTGHEQ